MVTRTIVRRVLEVTLLDPRKFHVTPGRLTIAHFDETSATPPATSTTASCTRSSGRPRPAARRRRARPSTRTTAAATSGLRHVRLRHGVPHLTPSAPRRPGTPASAPRHGKGPHGTDVRGALRSSAPTSGRRRCLEAAPGVRRWSRGWPPVVRRGARGARAWCRPLAGRVREVWLRDTDGVVRRLSTRLSSTGLGTVPRAGPHRVDLRCALFSHRAEWATAPQPFDPLYSFRSGSAPGVPGADRSLG